MCASSSTTRTLKLTDIPSIHHRAVIRVWVRGDGNINGLLHLPAPRGGRDPLAGPGWGSTVVLTGPEDQLERVPRKPEPLPDRFLQVPPVGEVEQADVIDEHHDRGRL